MKQNFFVSIAAIGLIGAGFAACKVTTTDTTGTSGTSGSTGSNTTTSGGGGEGGDVGTTSGEGGAGGGTTTAGTGGAGGAGDCSSCLEVTASDDLDIEDTCGYSDQGCEAGSSCEALQLLGACTCGDEDLQIEAKCADECLGSCGDGEDDGCTECVLAECQVEFTACSNDA